MSFKAAVNHLLSNKYLALTITLIILVLCSLPGEEVPLNKTINDKTAHFLAFGVWAFCWQGAYSKYTQTLILGFLYGFMIECWQGYILPESFNRHFDWYDMLADGVGVLIGLGLWRVKILFNL